MTNLTALADRVEAATGPDHELLLEAWVICFPQPESAWRAGLGFNEAWHKWNRQQAKFRHWLASGAYLDAAMTLVPEGVRFGLDGPVSKSLFGEREGKFCGVCGSVLENGFTIVSFAATPALALTAAALRARAQLTDGGSSD